MANGTALRHAAEVAATVRVFRSATSAHRALDGSGQHRFQPPRRRLRAQPPPSSPPALLELGGHRAVLCGHPGDGSVPPLVLIGGTAQWLDSWAGTWRCCLPATGLVLSIDAAAVVDGCRKRSFPLGGGGGGSGVATDVLPQAPGSPMAQARTEANLPSYQARSYQPRSATLLLPVSPSKKKGKGGESICCHASASTWPSPNPQIPFFSLTSPSCPGHLPAFARGRQCLAYEPRGQAGGARALAGMPDLDLTDCSLAAHASDFWEVFLTWA